MPPLMSAMLLGDGAGRMQAYPAVRCPQHAVECGDDRHPPGSAAAINYEAPKEATWGANGTDVFYDDLSVPLIAAATDRPIDRRM